MSNPNLTVLGEAEVQRALQTVADFDVAAAEAGAVNELLPTVASRTRKRYGILAATWVEDGGAFVNSMPYAVVQEFGSIYVEPTHAIQQTWDASEEAVTNAFSAEIERAADKAGFAT